MLRKITIYFSYQIHKRYFYVFILGQAYCNEIRYK